MIGFFEHQYLSYKKSHLSNLIALAKADGHLHEHEERLIYKVGEKYRLKEKQIKKLIDGETETGVFIPESHEKKMEQLYDLVRMVYADGVVEEDEIQFCKTVVRQFGIKEGIVEWMISIFAKENRPKGKAWEAIVKEAKERFMS